jgi:hypothetical protein
MASGSEITCITWTGDGAEKVIDAQRPINSVEIFNVTDGIAYTKLNTMAGAYAIKEDIAGARTYANSLVTIDNMDGAGTITFPLAQNVNAKVFHARIIC